MNKESYGQIAYEAYCASSDNKSLISGAILPHWRDVNPKIKAAWEDAAKGVINAFLSQQSER